MLHFLVVIGGSDRRAPRLDALMANRAPLPSMATLHHTRWHTEALPAEFAAWSSDVDAPVRADATSIALMDGLIIDPAIPSVDRILRALLETGAPESLLHVDGMYAVAVGRADGSGYVAGDRFGLSPLYRWTDGTLDIVSNRSPLLAAAVEAQTGTRPSRDRDTAMSVAVFGTAFGDESGYVGISRVPDRHRLEFDDRGVRVVEAWRDPWIGDDWAFTGSDESVADQIGDRLCDLFATVVDLAGGQLDAELTGGRDSRLVLALARQTGHQNAISFHTFGSNSSGDARLASWLADETGSRWEMRRLSPTDNSVSGFGARVASMAGEFGVGRVAPRHTDSMLCSGMMGEALGVKYTGLRPGSLRRGLKRAERLVTRGQTIVRTEVLDTAVELVRRDLAAAADRGCPSPNLFDGFYLRQRERRWIGSRPDRWDRVVFPLYSPDAIASVFGIDADKREAWIVHERLMERAGVPVADPPIPPAPPAAAPSLGLATGPTWAQTMVELVPRLESSPGADLLDMESLRVAASRFSELPRNEEMNLVNAMTALAWLDPSFSDPFAAP